MNQNCRARFPNGPDKRAVWETAPTFYDQNRSIWVIVDEYDSSSLYSSHNGFRIKSEIKLSEYNCNQDLVSSKTENQIGFSIYMVLIYNNKRSMSTNLYFLRCYSVNMCRDL